MRMRLKVVPGEGAPVPSRPAARLVTACASARPLGCARPGPAGSHWQRGRGVTGLAANRRGRAGGEGAGAAAAGAGCRGSLRSLRKGTIEGHGLWAGSPRNEPQTAPSIRTEVTPVQSFLVSFGGIPPCYHTGPLEVLADLHLCLGHLSHLGLVQWEEK